MTVALEMFLDPAADTAVRQLWSRLEQAVLFLGVSVHAQLLAAHAAVHAAIERESDELWELYRPGLWVPHCTLAMSLNADGLSRAFAQLHPYSAITGHVSSVNLVEVETGKATRLA